MLSPICGHNLKLWRSLADEISQSRNILSDLNWAHPISGYHREHECELSITIGIDELQEMAFT